MWRAYYHEAANITVRRYVANFSSAPWAEEAFALQLAMAHT